MPQRDGEVDRRCRLDERDKRGCVLADGGRQLAEDPLDLVALGGRGLRLAVRQLDDLQRLDEQGLSRARCVVDDAADAARRARLQREHGTSAALGDEVFLQMLAQPRRAREPAQLVDHALLARAQLFPKPAQEWGGVVAQVGAVVLDEPADLLRDWRKLRIDRGCDLGQQRRLSGRCVEGRPSAQAAGDRRGDLVQRFRREHAATTCERSLRPHVGDPFQRRLERLVDQRDRLGRQGLTSRDLVGIGRRHERVCKLGAVDRRGRARDPLDDRRELEYVECVFVHVLESTSANAAIKSSRPRSPGHGPSPGLGPCLAQTSWGHLWQRRAQGLVKNNAHRDMTGVQDSGRVPLDEDKLVGHDRSPGLGSCPAGRPAATRDASKGARRASRRRSSPRRRRVARAPCGRRRSRRPTAGASPARRSRGTAARRGLRRRATRG